MKYLRFGFSCLILFFLIACAGGPVVEDRTPQTILSGTREINKGAAFYQKGCYERSLEHFLRAHELYAAADHLPGVAMSLNNIGTVYRATGDFNSALYVFDESYRIYTEMQDDKGALQSLSNKAATLIEGGRLDEAGKVLDIAERQAEGMKFFFSPLAKNRAVWLAKRKDDARAEKMLAEALARTDPADFSGLATINFAMGNLLSEKGRPEAAASFFEKALAADRSAGFLKGIAADLTALGELCVRSGKHAEAAAYFTRGIKIYALMAEGEKAAELMEKLEAAAREANVDIRVTRHFVERWLDGKILENPCE